MPTLQVAVDGRKAEKGLKGIQASADKTRDSLGRFVGGAKKAETATTKLGKSASTAGALIGKMFVGFSAFMAIRAATKTIIEFDFAMAGVKAVTQASDGAMAEMARTARGLGATTQFSGKQAAEGMRFLGMAGFETEEILSAIPGTLNLALAGTLELGEAADIASNLISQFNLDASEMERIVDTLANTASSSNTSIRQLAEGMKFAGPIAGTLGISIEETAAAMGTLGDSGLQASLAGTGLRLVFAALLKSTSEAEAAIKRAGLSLRELSPESNTLSQIFKTLRDSTLSVTDTLTIFGRRGFGVAEILKLNADRVDELTEANIAAKGRAQEMADVFANSLQGRFLALKSVVEELTLQVGEEGLSGALRNAMDAMTMTFRVMAGMEDQVEGNIDTFKMFANIVESSIKVLGALIALKIAAFFTTAAIGVVAFTKAMTAAKWAAVGLKATLTFGLFVALDLIIDKFVTAGQEAGFAREEFQNFGRAAEDAKDSTIALAKAIEEGDKKKQVSILSGRLQALEKFELDARKIMEQAKQDADKFNETQAGKVIGGPLQDVGHNVASGRQPNFQTLDEQIIQKVSPRAVMDARLVGAVLGQGVADGLQDSFGQVDLFELMAGAVGGQPVEGELTTGPFKLIRDTLERDILLLKESLAKDVEEKSADVLSERDKASAIKAIEGIEAALLKEFKVAKLGNEERKRALFMMKAQERLAKSGLPLQDTQLDNIMAMFDAVQALNREREEDEKRLEVVKTVNESFEDTIAQMELELQLLRLSNDEREIQRTLLAVKNEFEKEGLQISEQSLSMVEKQARAVQKLKKEQDALIEAERELESFADSVGTAFVNSFEDAIFEGENLRDVLDNLAADVLKLTLRLILMNTIAGAISTGVQSFIGPQAQQPAGPNAPNTGFLGFASGGVVVGERGPEAVFPLDRTPSGDLGIAMPSGDAGVSNVTVNVVNNSGQEASVEEQETPSGRSITVMIGNAVSDDINRNGKIGQTISRVFGQKRKGIVR